jgi:hypothetical protein
MLKRGIAIAVLAALCLICGLMFLLMGYFGFELDVPAIKDLGTVLVSLGGLILAGISLYFSNRSSAAFRQKVYETQFDAYKELARAIYDQYLNLLVASPKFFPHADPSDMSSLLKTLADENTKVNTLVPLAKLLLPTSVVEILLIYLNHCQTYIELLRGNKKAPTGYMGTEGHIGRAYESMLKEMRKTLHIDPLTEKTMAILSGPGTRTQSHS